MRYIYSLILPAAILAMAGPASAHPHDPDKLSELREKTRALAEKAKASGDAIADSEMISNMADLLSDFAARVEVERGEDDGTALWFDGDEIVRFNGGDDKVLSVTGVGKNLTVDRETIIEDGKTRTRIVIEMDAGQDVQINVLPDDDSNE